MKILVLSDSHGAVSPMEQAVEQTSPDLILHLGDCWRDGERLHDRFPSIPLEQVPGNCDFRPTEPAERLLELRGKRILLCHGHTYGVKQSLVTAGFAAEDLRERGYVVEPLNLIVMDYSVLLQKYAPVASDSLVESVVAKARAEMDRNRNEEVYRFCFSALDLTTLSGSDSVRSVAEFVKKAVDVPVRFPGMPNVATVCVYPSFVDIAGLGVEGTNIGVTSVAGGFPAAQTYLEVKMLEVAMAVENGADEIDVVMNAGEMVEGEFDRLANDLELLCREAGQEVTFKVIIESGMLETPEDVYRASMLAILSGADFVKTSTGKSAYGATPKSAMVICNAIKDYYLQTGINVGIKLAGGIRTVDDAVLYYTIVENMLGREWLTPSLFRFGASAPLANALLSAVTGGTQSYF